MLFLGRKIKIEQLPKEPKRVHREIGSHLYSFLYLFHSVLVPLPISLAMVKAFILILVYFIYLLLYILFLAFYYIYGAEILD